MRSKWVRIAAALAGGLVIGAARAAGGGGSDSWSAAPAPAEDPAVAAARETLKGGDYAAAAAQLKAALAAQPGNADLHNLYAFAIRKGPNPDMALVFRHYQEALRLDPKHRGAQEYIGEAYLMVGNPAKAREHLAALDRLCFFGCVEYDMLKKAIAAYAAKPKP
jgi:predicted Zn-dependent protease